MYINNNMKKINFLTIVLIALIFTSCADASPYAQLAVTDNAYGFWGGLWHGMILFWNWIGTFIWDDVAIYAQDNNGGWYNFGFISGIGSFGKFLSAIIKLIK